MSNHARIGSLSARIGEVSRAIEKLHDELTDLGRQLQRAIAEEGPSTGAPIARSTTGPHPLVRRAGVILSPSTSSGPQPAMARRSRGRAGTMPAMITKVLTENPGRHFKPRQLAEVLGLSGVQARSLGITLLRLRKEGRVGFDPQTKTYHRPQAS